MKVCPLCQASYLEGFVYCPHDDALLEQYDLRAALRRRQQQELLLLLPTLSFSQRLQREMSFAAKEVRRHPWLFARELLRGESSPRQRIYWLQSGAAVAVMAYALIVFALVWWGVAYGLPGEKVVLAKPPVMDDQVLVIPLLPKVKSELTRGRNGHLGGSLPQPRRAHGGGSGGNQSQLQASGGVAPHARMQPQVVLPNPLPPRIETAKLVVTPHVIADPQSVLTNLGHIGLPDAPIAPPSQGRGKGGGTGEEDGTGVGKYGNGAGFNSGRKWNTGDGEPEPGGGKTTSLTGDREGVPMATGSMRPTILYREKARYTEEARHEKVQGAVVLLATFTADGRITNIRVLKGLPSGLTQEAIKAAQRIRFNPAIKNGTPVTVQARIEYSFSLY